MSRVSAFPPILGRGPTVLVLGSLPGIASLRARQYYAHPRNQFWDIMGELYGATRQLGYARRTAVLRARGVAVWDVLREASRPGSLDARIDTGTACANDVAALLDDRPSIRVVAFNGGTAAQLFNRFVRPALGGRDSAILYVQLPSTSPANATLNYATKLARWRQIAPGSGN